MGRLLLERLLDASVLLVLLSLITFGALKLAHGDLVDARGRLRTIGIHRRGRIISEAELDPERFYREVAIIGSPATCSERLAALRAELGIRYVNLLAAFFGLMPPQLERRSLERFAAEVMPGFTTHGHNEEESSR